MKRGFSIVELLIALTIASITLAAFTTMFIAGNRTFRANREVSNSVEEVRNAIMMLEFIFSRWGIGVPCTNNNCSSSFSSTTSIPNCETTYPPSHPLCMTVSDGGRRAIFYASLGGIGFVTKTTTSGSSTTANVIGCRLNSSSSQNCYYIWRNWRVKSDNGSIKGYRLEGNIPENHCLNSNNVSENGNLSLNGRIFELGSTSNSITLDPGDSIMRIPHKITIYVANDNWLMMDKTDMASQCNDDEAAIRVARVSSFNIEPVAFGVRIDATFLTTDNRSYSVTRYFGR